MIPIISRWIFEGGKFSTAPYPFNDFHFHTRDTVWIVKPYHCASHDFVNNPSKPSGEDGCELRMKSTRTSSSCYLVTLYASENTKIDLRNLL